MKNFLILLIIFVAGYIITLVNTPYTFLNLFILFFVFAFTTIVVAGICMTDKKPKGE